MNVAVLGVAGTDRGQLSDDDLDALYRRAADLETWEGCGGSAPAPLTRQAWDARRAEAATTEDAERAAFFVVDGWLREHAWVRGAYEDVVLRGILRSGQSTR